MRFRIKVAIQKKITIRAYKTTLMEAYKTRLMVKHNELHKIPQNERVDRYNWFPVPNLLIPASHSHDSGENLFNYRFRVIAQSFF
jgi:hypothetical protein